MDAKTSFMTPPAVDHLMRQAAGLLCLPCTDACSLQHLGLSFSPKPALDSDGAASKVSCTSSDSVLEKVPFLCRAAGVLCWLRCTARPSLLLLRGLSSLLLELLRRSVCTLETGERWGSTSAAPCRPFTYSQAYPCNQACTS